MKRLLTLILITFLFLGCKEAPKTNFTINGNAKGVYNGVRVYLKTLDFKTAREKIIDTAIVMNEKFTFNGALKYPELRFISINSVDGILPILIENNDINIDIKKSDLRSSTITGSIIHESLKKYENNFFAHQKKINAEVPEYRRLMTSANEKQKDSISKILQDKKEELNSFPIQYINQNKSNYLSLILLEQEIEKTANDIKICKEAFETLSEKLKASDKGKALSAKINAKYKIYLKTAHLEVGKVAPDFEAPTPDGTMASLNDLKGKVTIIDFWAAWCGPCRRENPNVVKVYEKYHDQGLEIIGVSLDGQSRQKDPKKAWLDAIAKDKLTWNHVSSLKYFNDPVAKLYNISAIPATYILDSEGIIVAKNLRGIALERKVQELLTK